MTCPYCWYHRCLCGWADEREAAFACLTALGHFLRSLGYASAAASPQRR